MHEVSLCESIMDILKEEAARAGAVRVKSVRLLIGELSGAVPDAMRFAFEVVSKGTLADGAALEIVSVPLTARCRGCGAEFAVEGYAFSCEKCGGPDIEIVSGRELMVDEVEME